MIHQTIKDQIKDAMRAKDSLKLEVLRGLQSLFSNELIAKGKSDPLLDDDSVLALIRRSVKQRKDSIEQFEKGGRSDLAEKEKQELSILETFLPNMMSKNEIRKIAQEKLVVNKIDKAKIGQFIGGLMKDLKGKADGADVKSVVEELVK
mgnify:FL=1